MALSKSSLKAAVASAFKVLGDIPESITYRRSTNTYVPSTGVNTVVNSDTTVTDAVFTSYENFEVDKVSVLSTDVKMIVQQDSLGLTPNIATDIILRGTKVYNIIRVKQDPAGATYTIQLRSP